MNQKIGMLVVFLLFTTTVRAQYQNICIGDTHSPEEPSIVINPKNPQQVLAGANLNLVYRSDDGGLTWQSAVLNSSFGVYGDPCLITDTAGNFYYFHLSNPPSGNWIDRIVCQRSTDGGVSWSDGSFMGLDGSKAQDKEWAVVDPLTNNIYVCWTQFDAYGSSSPADSSVILFSKSTDAGLTWSPAKRISRTAGDCLDSDSTVEGAVPAVGPGGEIYVSWAGPDGILFTRSTDEGETWLDTNILISDCPGGWDYPIPGIYRTNGLPVTCCDLSNGPYRGNIYVNWSDQRNGQTDTDIWFARSVDGGLHWSDRKRVNDDPPGKQQFFTWMTVDQKTGFIYFVFYDRRAYSTTATDVYMAVSRDGGETFQNYKISESPFTPDPGIFFGDYTGISASDQRVRPVWARLDGTHLSVWTAQIDSIFTGFGQKDQSGLSVSLDQNYPNPGRSVTYIAYKVHRPTRITLRVYDFYGREVATLAENEWTFPGRHIKTVDIRSHGLMPGLYYYSLTEGDRLQRKKMIIE